MTAHMSAHGKGFGHRLHQGRRRVFGGRRPKASSEGNRGESALRDSGLDRLHN